MGTFRVNVEPSVLKWARESVRLTEEVAAKKLRVAVERLREWESGSSAPTYSQLEQMAEKYKRPVAVLYLRQPPRHFDALRDFRRVLDSAGVEPSYELAIGLERVRRQQDVMREIYEISEIPPPLIDIVVTTRMGAEEAGTRVRNWLGLRLGQQREWARSHSLVPRLSELIEARGVLVTQVQDVPVSVMRGCALAEQPFPAIVLNGADARSAKAFTLVHELVHVLLRIGGEPGVVAVTKERLAADTEVERFCNAVAGAALVPRDALIAHEAMPSGPVEWKIGRLERIAADFGVSPEATLLRLVHLGFAAIEDYTRLRGLFAARQAGTSDRDAPIYYPLKVRDLGRRYIAEVTEAYERRDITVSAAADYLDIKINNLPRLLEELSRRRP